MDPPHSYHTRVHKNPVYPPFPPPNIVLHPDDATSKVFLAVARAFVSVDNRAMTIKDIAERASHYGLACQNLSAAAQAVTTYLRAHKIRCDKQQDVPLLLSHTLSGTLADDDLVPALYSRSGGDSHPLPNRLTNFRKGTAVWYLSRATGVPCPFAKAGIRLCDYANLNTTSDQSLPSSTEQHGKKRDSKSQEVCGLKRKRPLRGCVARASGSEDERPPKVKLTLRLKPLHMLNTSSNIDNVAEGSSSSRPIQVSNDQDDTSGTSDDADNDEDEEEADADDMSVDSSDDQSQTTTRMTTQSQGQDDYLPPYPRRSISIPCYTPSIEAFPSYPYESTYKDPFRRSPSVPNHFATPPPDSEDEDDYLFDMTRKENDPENHEHELGWDADLDSEGEGETVWESPGPRSPSAPIILPAEVTVKEEPTDVQGMLDAWDNFDTSVADARVADVFAKVLEGDTSQQVKTELVDPWELDANHSDWHLEDTTARIKQEEFDVDTLFPAGPSSPLTELSLRFAAFSYSDSSSSASSPPQEDNHYDQQSSAVRPRAQTVPVPHLQTSTPASSFSLSPPVIGQSMSGPSLKAPASQEGSMASPSVYYLYPMSANTSVRALNLPLPTACVSPSLTRCDPPKASSSFSQSEVVVTTCQPCKPAIRAIVLEGISVYQMMLGAFQLLRRLDTDFVNLSPIVAYSGSIRPVDNILNATVVTKGSPEVSGTWVPLIAAQAYVRENMSKEKGQALEVFLSDALFERFPPALHEFQNRRTTIVRGLNGLNQFGPHFSSTLIALSWESQDGAASPTISNLPQLHAVSAAEVPQVATNLGIGDKHDTKDLPLSATEQELFHELCVIPDEVQADDSMVVDVESAPVTPGDEGEMLQEPMSPLSPLPPSPPLLATTPMSPLSLPSLPITDAVPPILEMSAPSKPAEPPLRRSKRVASALAASQPAPTTRGRTRKGGSAK